MKVLQIIMIFFINTLIVSASVDKSINLAIPGSLGSSLTEVEKWSVTNLKVTGTIDKRDFNVLSSELSKLLFLDLSEVKIVSYTDFIRTYAANTIPNGAFSDNSKLQNITLPKNLKAIGYQAFYRSAITSIIIPDSVVSISDYAFAYCTNLVKISLPVRLSLIGRGVFTDCSKLTDINTLGSISSIDRMAFDGCISLRSIAIPNSVKSILSGAFDRCVLLSNVRLPDSLALIENNAFSSCLGFTSLSIPERTTTIEFGAFDDCTNLLEVHCKSHSPIRLQNEIFSNIDKSKCKLYVPIGCSESYKIEEFWKKFPNIIEEQIDNVIAPTYNSYTISGVDGILTIKTDVDIPINIYSISGKEVWSGIATRSLQLPLIKGVYLVKILNDTNKIMIK